MNIRNFSLVGVVLLALFSALSVQAVEEELRGFKGTVGVFCFDSEGRALPITSSMSAARRQAVEDCLQGARARVAEPEFAEPYGPSPTSLIWHSEGFIDRGALRRAEEALEESAFNEAVQAESSADSNAAQE